MPTNSRKRCPEEQQRVPGGMPGGSLAKRFTETSKWDKAWFRKLRPEIKCAWMFLCDRCDHAGIWHLDEEALEHFIGAPVSLVELLGSLGERVRMLGSDKLFISAFIDFQYGVLNPLNRVHKSVIDRLAKEGAYKPLKSPLQGVKDKDKDMDKDKVKDKDQDKEKDAHAMIEIWNAHRGNLPEARSCSSSRMKKIKLRWPEQSPEQWAITIQKMAASAFCNGKGSTGWRADFDFILKPDTWAKVNEGKYDDSTSGPRTAQTAKYDQLDALHKKWEEKQ